MTEIIQPRDKSHWLSLRLQDVTSTEVAALFGVSPYLTKFELWHRKRDQVDVGFVETDRVKWGARLEASIAKGIADDKGWAIRQKTEYIRDASLRAGASFDYEVEDTKRILEIKNVDYLMFKQGWLVGDDGEVEAAPHIELQLQQQMMLAETDGAYIGVLVGGNDAKVLEREADKEIQGAIKDEIARFWESVQKDVPPAPDFAKDAEFIRRLYQSAEAGKVVSANERVTGLALAYRELGERIKEMEAKRSECRAEILTMMGDASKMLGDGYAISAGTIKETEVCYVRKAYRDFRINFKKT